MDSSVFHVKTQVFEGPLDLLLQLIEKRKLHISDISIANVADDYISFVKELERFPIADSANFILVASTLLLIKSKSLLPTLNLTEGEQTDIQNLEERLRHLEKIKLLAQKIKEIFGKNILFSLKERKTSVIFSPDDSMTKENLREAMKSVLKNLPKKEVLPKVTVKQVISLEETIENLTKRITSSLRMSFKDFSKMGKEDRVNVIVSFLAMLELVKQGAISVSQEAHFDDIIMESEGVNTPRYE